jgi:hypothetical protein
MFMYVKQIHSVHIIIFKIIFAVKTVMTDNITNNNIAAGRWFSPGIPVSSANKTDHHDITEMLSKVG